MGPSFICRSASHLGASAWASARYLHRRPAGHCPCRVFFFKQKTAYETSVRDWSSDVCSSDLHDPRDATSSRRGVPYYERLLDTPVEGLRVGLPANYFFDGLDAAVDAAVRAAARIL